MKSGTNVDRWIKSLLCAGLVALFLLGLVHTPEVGRRLAPDYFWSIQVNRAKKRLVYWQWAVYNQEAARCAMQQALEKGSNRKGVPPLTEAEIKERIRQAKGRLIVNRWELSRADERYRRIKHLAAQAMKKNGK